jgi:hypothetical protein
LKLGSINEKNKIVEFLAVEWEHSDKTWSTELLGQGDMDKLTFKNIEKFLEEFAKIENETEE